MPRLQPQRYGASKMPKNQNNTWHCLHFIQALGLRNKSQGWQTKINHCKSIPKIIKQLKIITR